MKKYRKKVAYYFNYAIFFVALVLGVVLINSVVYSFNKEYLSELTLEEFLVLFNSIFVFMIISFCLIKILDKISTKIYERLSQYGQGYIFNITKGDKIKQEEAIKDDEKSGRKLITNLIISLIINVGCGIIVAKLCEFI